MTYQDYRSEYLATMPGTKHLVIPQAYGLRPHQTAIERHLPPERGPHDSIWVISSSVNLHHGCVDLMFADVGPICSLM